MSVSHNVIDSHWSGLHYRDIFDSCTTFYASFFFFRLRSPKKIQLWVLLSHQFTVEEGWDQRSIMKEKFIFLWIHVCTRWHPWPTIIIWKKCLRVKCPQLAIFRGASFNKADLKTFCPISSAYSHQMNIAQNAWVNTVNDVLFSNFRMVISIIWIISTSLGMHNVINSLQQEL